MRVCSVVGARPQFVKAAVVSRALAEIGIGEDLVHTGQHYDDNMSRLFFEELEIPEVAVNLGVGSGTHAAQTGAIMVRLEEFLASRDAYDVLLVYGDTNSTVAAAIVAGKLHIPLAHVEAGLRSFNRKMPEEINRIITDRLSQLLYCPSETAVSNLEAEGITEGVLNTGDVMYDALLRYLATARDSYPLDKIIPYRQGEYYLATVHRAENTDDKTRLGRVIALLDELDRPVVWPIHPRTAARLTQYGIAPSSNVHQLAPRGYLGMLALLDGCAAVLTDSGGLQKEAFWLGKPCVTLRSETEWVETLNGGWNVVAGLDRTIVKTTLSRSPTGSREHAYGKGDAAHGIARSLVDFRS